MRCARMPPGEVLKPACGPQLPELTTAPMERADYPPDDGFTGEEGPAQRLLVAMKQRFAAKDTLQGAPKAAQQDSSQAEVEPNNHGRTIPQDFSCGTVVASGNPPLSSCRSIYKPEKLSFRLGLPALAPVQLVEFDVVVAHRRRKRTGECGLARAAGADHDDALRSCVDRHGGGLCTCQRRLARPAPRRQRVQLAIRRPLNRTFADDGYWPVPANARLHTTACRTKRSIAAASGRQLPSPMRLGAGSRSGYARPPNRRQRLEPRRPLSEVARNVADIGGLNRRRRLLRHRQSASPTPDYRRSP